MDCIPTEIIYYCCEMFLHYYYYYDVAELDSVSLFSFGLFCRFLSRKRLFHFLIRLVSFFSWGLLHWRASLDLKFPSLSV